MRAHRPPPLIRRALPSAKLARIQTPCIVLLRVPLLWQQDEPLLTRRLLKLRVRIPCPQKGTRWQDLAGPRAPLVRQPIGDAHHAARIPDEMLLAFAALALLKVLPQDFEPLADELTVEGRRIVRLHPLHGIGDARLDPPLPRRLRLYPQLLGTEE
eukprot:6712562-Prymnesium_polylepis.1